MADEPPCPLPGLQRALALVAMEAKSFPGPEGSAAMRAVTAAIEREMRKEG